MTIIAAVVFAGLLQTFCLLFGLRWLINREKRQLAARFRELAAEWLTPQEEGKPHKAAELLDLAGTVIGAAAARSIMASLNAEKSHMARVANGMTDELQGKANPIMGLLAGGKRGKGAALMQLAQMLGPMLGGGNHQGNGAGGAEYTGRRHRD